MCETKPALPCNTSLVSDTDDGEPFIRVETRAMWADVSTVPVRVATHFAANAGMTSADGVPDGIYLTLGHVQFPLLVGSRDEVAKRLAEGLTVSIEGRFLLTRSRLKELIEVLNNVADQYDGLVEQAKEGT